MLESEGGVEMGMLGSMFQKTESLPLTLEDGWGMGQEIGAAFKHGGATTNGWGFEESGCGFTSNEEMSQPFQNLGANEMRSDYLTEGYEPSGDNSSDLTTSFTSANISNLEGIFDHAWLSDAEISRLGENVPVNDMVPAQSATNYDAAQAFENLAVGTPSTTSRHLMYDQTSSPLTTTYESINIPAIDLGPDHLYLTTGSMLQHELFQPPRLPHTGFIEAPLPASTAFAPTSQVTAMLNSPSAKAENPTPIPTPTPTTFIPHALVLPKPRNFVCSINGCTTAYHRRAELHRHQRTHTGTRPHACRFARCDRAGTNGFWRKDHLRQHLRQRHGV